MDRIWILGHCQIVNELLVCVQDREVQLRNLAEVVKSHSNNFRRIENEMISSENGNIVHAEMAIESMVPDNRKTTV